MQISAGTIFTRAARLVLLLHLLLHLLLLLLLVEPLIAEVVQLCCSVTELHDGHYQYQLNSTLPQDCTDQSWEDFNKTVLTQGLKTDQTKVQNLTDRTLVLKLCESDIYFSAQCQTFIEAFCSVNCTSEPRPTSSPPETSFYFLVVVPFVLVAGVILVVLLVVWFVWFVSPRFKHWLHRFQSCSSKGPEVEDPGAEESGVPLTHVTIT